MQYCPTKCFISFSSLINLLSIELKSELQALVAYYCRLLPSCLEGYRHASLQVLAEFLHDPLSEVSSCARACFSASAMTFSMNEKRDKIVYWAHKLPSRSLISSESSILATIILGNLCVDDSRLFTEE